MTDNKKYIGKQDRIRVDSRHRGEVEYVHRKFPRLSHQAVHSAIRVAGPMRKNIMQYLSAKYGS